MKWAELREKGTGKLLRIVYLYRMVTAQQVIDFWIDDEFKNDVYCVLTN